MSSPAPEYFHFSKKAPPTFCKNQIANLALISFQKSTKNALFPKTPPPNFPIFRISLIPLRNLSPPFAEPCGGCFPILQKNPPPAFRFDDASRCPYFQKIRKCQKIQHFRKNFSIFFIFRRFFKKPRNQPSRRHVFFSKKISFFFQKKHEKVVALALSQNTADHLFFFFLFFYVFFLPLLPRFRSQHAFIGVRIAPLQK